MGIYRGEGREMAVRGKDCGFICGVKVSPPKRQLVTPQVDGNLMLLDKINSI